MADGVIDRGLIPMKQCTIFEVAWEVANKVGGIHTVIKSKLGATMAVHGDQYIAIGPLKADAQANVERLPLPEGPIKTAVSRMSDAGMHVVYGRWLVEGNPQVLLMDIGSQMHMLNQWKGDLYAITSVNIPDIDGEVNDYLVFAGMVATLMDEYNKATNLNLVCAHFHEWQVGITIPLLKKRNIPVATVFTTHATLLGRFLCAGETDFYNNLPYFDPDREAGNRNIFHRYAIEKSAAHCCHVFSTVSGITADEATHLLRRKPEVVMPNGLNVVNEMHEFQNLHVRAKDKINKFVLGHFAGHYNFDIDKTLYFFTAGRYEFLNKGVDVFLESLARLNYRLKQQNSDTTVIAFLIFPAANNNYNTDTLKGQGTGNQLRDSIDTIKSNISTKIYESVLSGEMPDTENLLDKADSTALKRAAFSAQRSSLPPIVTHNLHDDSKDPILASLRRMQLYNHPDDRVKVIFHPQFLNKQNPLLPIDYEEFVRGCHMGVFPSYYEPWGYTPAECVVRGIPAITSNLAGFGRFIETKMDRINPAFASKGVRPGVCVVDRRYKSLDESIDQLCGYMHDFCSMSRRDRINQRNCITENVAELLDWKELNKHYTDARERAVWCQYAHRFQEGQQ